MPRSTLIAAMGSVIDLIGEPVPAAGYYGPTDGLHTISIRTLNFRGRIHIEGSLATAPGDQDWFAIMLEGKQYLDFPMIRYVPRHEPGWFGDSVTLGYSVAVNANWLRARVIRSHMIPPIASEQAISYFGSVDTIFVQF